MPLHVSRVQRHHLPSDPTPCSRTACVYNEDGVCDGPSINKGNSDAECHLISNRAMYAALTGDVA